MTGTGLNEGVTGSAAEALDSTQSGNKALAIVGAATFLLILILLLVIFRAPIIAIMPLILIGIAYEVAVGLISDVNQALNLNSTAQDSTILLVVLFGIGTDYFLFLMFRYRERLRLGDDKKEAMVQSVTRVGEVIASAACVVIAAFLALTLSSLSIFRSLGPTLAIAVAVTLIAALTLIPAVVSLIGHGRVLAVEGVAAGAEGRRVHRDRRRPRPTAGRLRGRLRPGADPAGAGGAVAQADVRPVVGGHPVHRGVADRAGHPGEGLPAGRDRADSGLPAHVVRPADDRRGDRRMRPSSGRCPAWARSPPR